MDEILGSAAVFLFMGTIFALIRQVASKPKGARALPAPPAPEDRAEKVRRVLKHVTRKKINELVEGEAAVVIGVAQPLPNSVPLTSPMNQQPCIAYHVEQRAPETFNSLLQENANCSDFLLRDDTSEVLVRGLQLDFAVAAGPWVERYVPDATGQNRLHREALLLPGAEVSVCGAVVLRSIASADYRDSQHQMEIVATPTFPAVASTDDDLIAPPREQISPAQLRG